MGDISLLAGSPSDAADHYATALELARTSFDAIWAGAALEGIACAKVRGQRCCFIRVSHHVTSFPASTLGPAHIIQMLASAWPDARQQSGTMHSRVEGPCYMARSCFMRVAPGPLGARMLAQVLDACLSSGALRSLSLPGAESPPESPLRNPKITQLQAQEAATATSSVASHASSGFGGSAFWAALRDVEDLERDVRDLLGEARQILRKRGALSLLVRVVACRGQSHCPRLGA